MKIIGIDPGLATGAAVLLEVGTGGDEHITNVCSSRTSPCRDPLEHPGDREFTDSVRRAIQQAGALSQLAVDGHPDLIVIESFVDLPSRKGKQDRKRWQTPLVIGLMVPVLTEIAPVRYQNPSVLRQFHHEVGALSERNRRREKHEPVCKGDLKLKNPHLITAACHAWWASARV